jgi:tetratricopeptide (TPR) repeat protein
VSAPPGSDVTLRASVLETNGRERETFVNVKVIQSMELKPEWLQPGIGDEVPAGAAKILRWHTPKEGFLQDSVAIFASVDGGPEDLVGKVLPLSGSLWYRIPDEEGGRLRLRLVARTAKGREVAAILDELLIKTSAQKLLSWIHPRESAVWKGGETVQLQWTSLRGDLREKSAHLYYSVDGGRWTLVTRGLDPAAFYFWTVPWRNGAQLRLKVTARTRGGTGVEAVTPTVTVEATTRPDIAMAKRHADRARIHVARNQTAQASLEYEKALAIWPDYPEALNDLGTVYSSEKQYAKALEYFLRAKRSAPSSPFPYVNAASMEIQLGLPIDALEDLRDSVELGVDRHQRLALQAGERLWQLSKLFQISGESERSEDACGLILRIRTADRRLRRQAEAALTGSGGR